MYINVPSGDHGQPEQLAGVHLGHIPGTQSQDKHYHKFLSDANRTSADFYRGNQDVLGTLRGVQEWAYESPVDDSGQPFILNIPTDYKPARPPGLFVSLHFAMGDHRQWTDFILSVEVTTDAPHHEPRRCLKGRTACAVFHHDAQRLRWNLRQRQTIFRLLLQDFGQIIGTMANGNHYAPAAAWRLTVESWLPRQGLISIRQNQKQRVSTTSLKFWSQN